MTKYAIWYRTEGRNPLLKRNFSSQEEVAVEFLKLKDVAEFIILAYDNQEQLEHKLMFLNVQ